MTTVDDRTQTAPERSAVRAIVTGLVIAGVLDAGFAVVVDVVILRAFSLLGVLQWIASGLLGRAAFAGGLATAALGVAIHFALAAVFAAFYYAVSTRVDALRTQAATLGVAYGAAIWLLMDLVILPRSGAPLAPFDPFVFGAFLLDHMFFVGLPIALAVKRYAP
jgi:uncharacterized membrane protein YagU involved in acid resistance